MHPAGVCTEQLTIEHKGKPCDGMPVGRMACCKRPDNAVRGQTVQNVLVFRYIGIIIVIGKFKIPDLPEDQQSTQYQGTINENNDISLRKFEHTYSVLMQIGTVKE